MLLRSWILLTNRLSLEANTRRVLSCQTLNKKNFWSSIIPGATWCGKKQQSFINRYLLAILRKVQNFKLFVQVHLWGDCLEILHRWFLGPHPVWAFWQAMHNEILIFLGHMKHPDIHTYVNLFIFIYFSKYSQGVFKILRYTSTLTQGWRVTCVQLYVGNEATACYP